MLYVRIERPDEPKTVRSTTPRMASSAFTGNADAVAEHIERYADAGLDHALMLFESESVDDLVRQMQTFAEQVAPRFAGFGLAGDASPGRRQLCPVFVTVVQVWDVWVGVNEWLVGVAVGMAYPLRWIVVLVVCVVFMLV